GVLVTTISAGRYLALNTFDPQRMSTCSVSGFLGADMVLRDGECMVSLAGADNDGLKTVASQSCGSFCGMGGTFDGQYVASPPMALVAERMGEDGRVVYRAR
ncbi:MAG: hypothetical protein HY985_18985, partial [Magnetospirillum sp.]|nr:hypothetical protein [Magnetospirillum sp.]